MVTTDSNLDKRATYGQVSHLMNKGFTEEGVGKAETVVKGYLQEELIYDPQTEKSALLRWLEKLFSELSAIGGGQSQLATVAKYRPDTLCHIIGDLNYSYADVPHWNHVDVTRTAELQRGSINPTCHMDFRAVSTSERRSTLKTHTGVDVRLDRVILCGYQLTAAQALAPLQWWQGRELGAPQVCQYAYQYCNNAKIQGCQSRKALRNTQI